MRNFISIDIETLSTNKNALILSIGACYIQGSEVVDTFYTEISKENSLHFNRHVDPRTEAWWSEQENKGLPIPDKGTTSLINALEDLSKFVSKYPNDTIWAKGPAFDLAILESAYEFVNIETPWKFWNVRDVRTILDVTPFEHIKDLTKTLTKHLTAHNALDDAVKQAIEINTCLKILNETNQT